MSQYRTQPDDVTHEQAETDNHDGNSERDEQFNGRIPIPHHISPQPFQVPRQEEEMQQIDIQCPLPHILQPPAHSRLMRENILILSEESERQQRSQSSPQQESQFNLGQIHRLLIPQQKRTKECHNNHCHHLPIIKPTEERRLIAMCQIAHIEEHEIMPLLDAKQIRDVISCQHICHHIGVQHHHC